MSFPTYFEALDIKQLLTDYPVGDAFTARYRAISRDELFAIQDRQFVRLMQRGWEVPFYQRLWGEQGIEPGDIKGLADITRLPVYDKSDLMAAVNAHPPYGDFDGRGSDPVVFHTTSGTTGRPQPLMFGPKGREVGNLLVGRMYRWMGLRPEDVVHSVYGHGMINGGHYIREAVTHFTNSLFLSAGTGIETRSVNQVQLLADFGATVMVGFVDYIRKLAEVSAPRTVPRPRRPGTAPRLLTGTGWATPAALRARGRSATGSMCGKTRSFSNCSMSKAARRWPGVKPAIWS
jgi:phenylacetate-CoA ligase